MRFRIRQSTDIYLSVDELDKLCNPYSNSADEFIQIVKHLVKTAKEAKQVQFYGGGGILDLWVHPHGVIDITKSVMCLDLEEDPK